MNGARFVHDELVSHGWEVLVADAQKVKGLAPLACKTDKIDARVLALHRSADRLPVDRHPTGEPVQAVTIRGCRDAVDQLPLIGDQAHLNLFATQIQTNMQHEHSSPATTTGRIDPAHRVP
jgi:hypothetical protein